MQFVILEQFLHTHLIFHDLSLLLLFLHLELVATLFRFEYSISTFTLSLRIHSISVDIFSEFLSVNHTKHLSKTYPNSISINVDTLPLAVTLSSITVLSIQNLQPQNFSTYPGRTATKARQNPLEQQDPTIHAHNFQIYHLPS